jgi:hypothetical protein
MTRAVMFKRISPERRAREISNVRSRITKARKDVTAAYASASVVVTAARLHFIGLLIDPKTAEFYADITAAHNEWVLAARRSIVNAEARLKRALKRLAILRRGARRA